MTSDTARRTVDFLLRRSTSGRAARLGITFFGGEPFLAVERIAEIVGYTRERDTHRGRVSFYATTNGTVATPAVERVVRDAHMGLLVSLDGGPDANLSRPYVSGRSSYDAVVRHLPRLVSWAESVTVRMTFHPQALALVDNVRHALDLGAPSVALCPVVEADWTGCEARLEAEYEALADWFITAARRGHYLPLPVTRTLLAQWHAHMHGVDRPARPCHVGTHVLGIDTAGHVMPCHRFLYRPQDWLGTVAEPLAVEARAPYVALTSDTILGCDGCSARAVCGGGCRLVALTAGLGLTGSHPGHCLTMRAHARAVRHIYHTLMAEQPDVFTAYLLGNTSMHPALTELIP
jgi:uncharacterized protein